MTLSTKPTRGRSIRKLLPRTPLDAPILLLVLTALLGCAVAVDPAVAQTKLIWFIVQVSVFYGLVMTLRSEKNIGRVARLLVVVTAILALIGLIGTDWEKVRLFDIPGLYDRIPRLLSGLPSSSIDPDPNSFNPRRIGAAIAMLLPLSVVMLIFSSKRWDRLLAFLSLMLGGLVLILSQAIMGLFGLVVALIMIGIWWRRWLLWVTLAGLITFVVATFLLFPRQMTLDLLDINHPLGIAVLLRLDIWSRSLAMIYDLPFTGIGLDNFPLVQSNFYIGQLIGPEPHAHNLILQTLNDLGLFGLLGLLWFLLAFFLTAIHGYRSSGRDMQLLLIGLSAGVLAFFSGGLLDSMALGDRPTLILWVMMGLGTAISVNANRQAPTREWWWLAANSRWLLLIPLILVLASLLLFPSARQRNQSLVTAYRAIYESRDQIELPPQEVAGAITGLKQAIEGDPDNPELFGALASLNGQQGEFEAAVDALRERIALDGRDPTGQYAPFISWRRQLIDQPAPEAWQDLLQIYRPWRNRFPDRAEAYVLTALVLAEKRNDLPEAMANLQQGLNRGAEPRGLLLYYYDQLQDSES